MAYQPTQYRCERLPGESDVAFGWDMFRASAEFQTLLTLITSDIFGIRTHYLNRRTVPCAIDDCPGCKANQLSRWHGYLLAMNHRTGTRCVWEFTPPAAVVLDRAFKEFGSLRTLDVKVGRTSKRPNAKVKVEIVGATRIPGKVLPEIDVWPVLSHIWGLTTSAPAKFSEFLPENLPQFERATLDKETYADASDENAWASTAANDLAGQLILPGPSVNGSESRNGRYAKHRRS